MKKNLVATDKPPSECSQIGLSSLEARRNVRITFIHVLLTTGRGSVLKSTGHATVSVLWLHLIDFSLLVCIMQARLPNQF